MFAGISEARSGPGGALARSANGRAFGRSGHRQARRSAAVLLIAFAWAASGGATHARGADHVWNGTVGGSELWSHGANWLGGTAPAPGTTIGLLAFPETPGSSPDFEGIEASSRNDLANLTVGRLDLSRPTHTLTVSGNPLTLGSGGITAAPFAGFSLAVPVTLGASQTWSLDRKGADPDAWGRLNVGELTGPGADLTVHLAGGSILGLEGNNQLGDLTVTSTGVDVGALFLNDAWDSVGGTRSPRVNDANGRGLTIVGPTLFLQTDATVGSFESRGSWTSIGRPFGYPTGKLSATNAQFDAASGVSFWIVDQGVPNPGVNQGQLAVTGSVDLGGATLALDFQPPTFDCPMLSVGRQYTLVSTPGALTGRFGNAPNGAIYTSAGAFGCGQGQRFRINYQRSGATKTVTATVVSQGEPEVLVPDPVPDDPDVSGPDPVEPTVPEREEDARQAPSEGGADRPIPVPGGGSPGSASVSRPSARPQVAVGGSSADSVAQAAPRAVVPRTASVRALRRGIRVTVVQAKPRAPATVSIRAGKRTLRTIRVRVGKNGRATWRVKLSGDAVRRARLARTIAMRLRVAGPNGRTITIVRTVRVR